MVEPSENIAVEALLKAEEEANNIIKEAKLERENKLKEAKNAAEKEISNFRTEEEVNFQKEIEKRYKGSEEDQTIENQTKEEIAQIYKDYEENKENVMKMLIERILNVEIEIPLVLKGNLQGNFPS